MTWHSVVHRFTGVLLGGAVATLVGLLFTLYNYSVVQLFGGPPPPPGSPYNLTGFLNWLFAILIGFAVVGIHDVTHLAVTPSGTGRGRGK